MPGKLAAIALLPLLAAAAFAVAYFVFYRGGYDPQPSPAVTFDHIETSAVPPRVSSDPPAGGLRQGLLLIDAQHANSFSERELVNFVSRVADRGYDVEMLGDFTPIQHPSQVQPRLSQMAAKLRQADSFVVILPQVPYSGTEAALVEGFVRKGGRLLLVSDPGRPQSINELAQRFGVDFQSDYLYNTRENDANFKRILVREFQPDQLTSGLETITFEYAGSLQSSGEGLAFTSANTRSSVLESTETYTPMAWGSSRNVLAISDFTFMVPINDSLMDNGKLVSNIADYLTSSEREFHLSDFPYFYRTGQADSVDILIGRPDLLSTGQQIKTALANRRINARVAASEDFSRDSLFLGLYDDAPQVAQYLAVAGVRIDDTLGTASVPELPLENSTVMVLDQGQDRNMLVLLADSPASLNGAVSRLLSGEFRGDLVDDFVALRRFEEVGQMGP